VKEEFKVTAENACSLLRDAGTCLPNIRKMDLHPALVYYRVGSAGICNLLDSLRSLGCMHSSM